MLSTVVGLFRKTDVFLGLLFAASILCVLYVTEEP